MNSSRSGTPQRAVSLTPPSSPSCSTIVAMSSSPPTSPASNCARGLSDEPPEPTNIPKHPPCLLLFNVAELWGKTLQWIEKPCDFLSLALVERRRSGQTILCMHRRCAVPWIALLRLLFTSPKLHSKQKPLPKHYERFRSRATRVRHVKHDTTQSVFPEGWDEAAYEDALTIIKALPVEKEYGPLAPFAKVTTFTGRIDYNNTLAGLAVPVQHCLSSTRTFDRISIEKLSRKGTEAAMPIGMLELPGFWSCARTSRSVFLQGIAFNKVPERHLKDFFSSTTLNTISLKSSKREGNVAGVMLAIAENATATTHLEIETNSHMSERPRGDVRFGALKSLKIYAASISPALLYRVFAPEVEQLDISVEDKNLAADAISAIRNNFPKRRFFNLCQHKPWHSDSLEAMLACGQLAGLMVTNSRWDPTGSKLTKADVEKWEKRGYMKHLIYFDLEYEDCATNAFRDMAIPVMTGLTVEDLVVFAGAAPKLESFTLGLHLHSDSSSTALALESMPVLVNCTGVNLLFEVQQATLEDGMTKSSKPESSVSIVPLVFNPIFGVLATKLPSLDLEQTTVWVRNIGEPHGLQLVSGLFVDEYCRVHGED